MRAGLKNNIPEIKSRMARVAWATKAEYRERCDKALRDIRDYLMRMTPKSSGKMASGWQYRIIGGSKKGRAAVSGWIWNHWAEKGRWRYQSRSFTSHANYSTFSQTSARSGAQMSSKKGDWALKSRKLKIKTDGRTVLKVLEFGSQPHTIRAAHLGKGGKPGYLRFMSVGSKRAGSQIGGYVFAKKVEHPGTKPHAMIRKARVKFHIRIKEINGEVKRIPQKVMRGEIKG